MMSWVQLHYETRVARKEHQCYLCGENILVKEIHRHQVGVMDGEYFDSLRFHVECRKETEDWDEGDWESFEEGTLDRPK